MKHHFKIACLGDAQSQTDWFELLEHHLKLFMDQYLIPDHGLDITFLRSFFTPEYPHFPQELIKLYGLRHLHYNHQLQLASQANITVMIGQDYHPLDDYTRDFFQKITELSTNVILWFTPDHAESEIPSKAQIESKTNVIPASKMGPDILAILILYLLTPNKFIPAKDQNNDNSNEITNTQQDDPPPTDDSINSP
jgi:hypothetical protein